MQAGTVLGPYRIERELGSGGMGKVYAAVVEGRVPGIAGGARVALKVVHPHLLETEGFFRRFLREGEIGKAVRHENVVRTLDADALRYGDQLIHFLVMEYVEGQTLRELADDLGRVPEALCRHIAREVAKGLAAVHAAGVIHRDLKPENVLITPEHEIRVMDLGVARLQDEAVRLSQTGAFVGSVLYGAPEQFVGREGGVDGRADLYALGLTLYELAAGRHPFTVDDPRAAMLQQIQERPRPLAQLNPQLSPFFEEVVHTLLEKDAADRLQSADELLRVLEEGESSAWWQDRERAIRVQTLRPLRRVRIPRETALYGRADELARLQELFDSAKAGEGQVVRIEGEAGIGKTRMVDEFVAQLAEQGEDLNFLFGSYPPGGAATAAGAISTAYREHFGEADLEQTLSGLLTETPRLSASFAAVLRGGGPPEGHPSLTRDSLQAAFVQATRALASERPTVILIDDLHYAPEEGLALIAALAVGIAGHRVLLIATTRRGLSEKWVAGIERFDHASRIVLPRLGPKDLAKLLVDAFGSERVAEELGFKIATKSDGNPFFVFEIIRGLREGQFLTQRSDGTWTSTADFRDLSIPSSVADLIRGRIAVLDEHERELLDVASCCGFEFDAALLSATLGTPRVATLRRLARIEQMHQLVRASGRRFVFDHHQVQEALYAGLPQMLREEYRAALGDALESLATKDGDGGVPGEVAVELCEHFLAGVAGARALVHLDAALQHLDDGYLSLMGADLLGRALALPGLLTGAERVAHLTKQATRFGIAGRRDEERAALDEASLLAEADDTPATLAQVYRGYAAHFGNTSRYAEAAEYSEKQLAAGRASGDRKIESEALRFLGMCAEHRGRFAEARRHFDQALVAVRELESPHEESLVLNCLGTLASLEGDFDAALEYHARSLGFAREAGDGVQVAIALGDTAVVGVFLGLLERARDGFDECLGLFAETGDRSGVAQALSNLGELYVALGDVERAREHGERAAAIGQETGARFLIAFEEQTRAMCAELDGDPDAERLHRNALAMYEALELAPYVVSSHTSLGALLLRLGRTDEAREHLVVALDVADNRAQPSDGVEPAAWLATLPGGDAAAALERFRAHEPRLAVLPKLYARFALWKATDDPEHLHAAHDLVMHLRDNAPASHRDSMLENVPAYRDIAAAARDPHSS